MQVPEISTMDAGFGDRQRAAKLADGAHQFEAMMLQQMLKPLNFGATPDAEDDGSQDTLQSYGTEALAKAIASRGGFGMADRIIQQVSAEEAAKSGGKEAKVV